MVRRAVSRASLLFVVACRVATADAQQRTSPDPPAPVVAQIKSDLRAGNLVRARASADTVVAKYPSSGEAHYLFGLVAEGQGDLAGAARALEQAVSLSPNHAAAHDRLGFVLGRQGRTEEAIGEFARAAELNPRLFDAQYHLGATALVDEGSRRRAPAAPGCGAAAAGPCGGALLPRADARGARTNRTGDRRAAKRRSANPEAGRRAQRGWGWRSRRSAISTERSRSSKLRCASIPRRPDARNSLGLALSQKGRGDEAVAVFSELVDGPARLHAGAAESRHRADAAGRPRRSRRRAPGAYRARPPTPKRSTTSASR